MRIQCPQCQELAEVTRFTTATDPPRIEFLCPACGEQVSQAAEGGAVSRPASAPPAEEAPDPAASGTETAAAGSNEAAAAPSAQQRAGQDALWNSWDHLTEAFADTARHDAFLAACEIAEALPFAAARYREWAESHPEDAIAPARLKRVAALAQVKVLLRADRGAKEKDPVRQVVMLGFVLILILAAAVITAPLIFRGLATDKSRGSGRLRTPATMEPALRNLQRPRPPRRRPPPAPVRDGAVPGAPALAPDAAPALAPDAAPGGPPAGPVVAPPPRQVAPPGPRDRARPSGPVKPPRGAAAPAAPPPPGR